MKNYKHSFKTNNKMKLATVAASAIMLAPVAMSSVSTFAATGTYQGAAYPQYTVYTVAQAAAAKENGTNGQVSSSMNQGATTGYSDAEMAALIAAVEAIPTTSTQTSNANYVAAATKLTTAGDKVVSTADTSVSDGSLKKGVYEELTDTEKTAQESNIDALQNKYAALRSEVNTAKKALQDNSHLADWAIQDAEKAPNDQLQVDVAASRTAKAQQAQKDYQTAIAGFTSLNTAVKQYNELISRKTNNGAVTQAAIAAGAAIDALPAGTLKTQLQGEYNKVQGDYYLATSNHKTAAKDHAAMDAAATKAVSDLNDIAGEAFKGGANVSTGANGQAGVVKVNYPAGYGIQIWTAAGKAVRYNKKEAALNNAKVGDAKKLPGQKSYKVYNVNGQAKTTMNGTTYYNLGGDQYIDAAYVTFTATK